MSTKLSLHVTVLVVALALAVIGVLLMGTGTVAAEGPDPQATAGESSGPVVSAPSVGAEDAAAVRAANYLHVSGSAFVPRADATAPAYDGAGCRHVTGLPSVLEYALALPYKANVTELRLYFKDSNVANNGTLYLARYNDGIDYTYLMTVTTTGNAGTPAYNQTNDNITLDYDNYSYNIVWLQGAVVDASLQFCGFKVGYTAPNLFGAAMPQILR